MVSAFTKYRLKKVLFITGYWILSSLFFVLIRGEGVNPGNSEFESLKITYLLAGLGGFLIGIAMGLLEIFIYPKFVKNHSYGYSARLKSFVFAFLILSITFLLGMIYGKESGADLNEAILNLRQYFSSSSFLSLVFYLLVSSIILDFVMQMNQKFGPGMLLKFLNGTYYHPKEESRIFMFLDLHDSTPIAESLGHIRFSYFLQDCFKDLSEIVLKYEADIYQFVGDEAVLTWLDETGIRNANCLKIYYEFEKILARKKTIYYEKYGICPVFKASINMGKVTAAEVGVIKSEIAFHGDVLNTASRVQKLCGVYNKNLLLTEPVVEALSVHACVKANLIDLVSLKGKNKQLNIYSATIAETTLS